MNNQDLTTLLAELDAAVAKMTPGPWHAIEQLDEKWRVDGNDDDPLARCAQGYDEQRANAQGIVALVNAYPRLREGIEQLQRELAMCRSYLALIEERRDPPPDAALDGADPAIVRLELLQCLRAWEPAARVLGNVRACDAERAIVEGQDRVAALEQELGEIEAALPDRGGYEVVTDSHGDTYTQTVRTMERQEIIAALVEERDEARAERNARARDVMHLEALVEQQREALRGFVDAFQLDWSGHKLGDLIEKARAVLAQEVPRG